MRGDEPWRGWHIPLSEERMSLRQGLASLATIALQQREIPLIVQLVENPRFDLPFVDLFPGATNLRVHDCIHILLGRGLCEKDEAFVLGFTMGSTDRMGAFEEKLYTFIARNFYPKGYRFDDEETRIYQDALRLGHISDVKPMHAVNYESLLDVPLADIRRDIGLEPDLLRAYYAIEQRRYPGAVESQRLLR